MWVIEFLVDLLGYATARRLVPIVSFGMATVESVSSTERGFNWLGIKHEADGRYLLSSVMASLLGGLFWFALLAFVLTMWSGR